MRQQIVAGNWKMNKSLSEGIELVKSVLDRIDQRPRGPVVFGVPYPYLQAVAKMLQVRKGFHVAAQNCHHEEKGAFTGEVSVDMLASVGTEYVIIGHSERRQYFKETNEHLARKVNLALAKGLLPIFCCGEPLNIRERGTHVGHVAKQLKASLFHLHEAEFRKVVIAYEPIWAIGTGRTASTEQAQEMHAAIRVLLSKKYGKSVADDTSILYGGSCNAQNAPELFRQPDVDGGLIGGASLKPEDFVAIVNAMQ
ncbi:MAG: triose-phosphate isomerase [Saprospiraceae bacterium]